MTEIPKFHPTLPREYPKKENVVGQAREFLDELSESMDNASIYNSLGVKPEKTYIISSLPGTGKTLSINALNNSKNEKITNILEKIVINDIKDEEALKEKNIIQIDDFKMFLFEYDIGKYGTSYINLGSKIIQKFFNTIYAVSTKGVPTLVSIDECDSLFTSRKSRIQSHSEDRKVLNTLMKNLQISHDRDNIYVVMMTNYIEQIDEASIRAGRVDRRIVFDLPNETERKTAYKNAIDTINKNAKYQVIRNFNLEDLSNLSNGFNYADIYQCVEQAIKDKAKKLIRTKKPGIIRAGYIKQKSLEKTINRHKKEFKTKQEEKVGFI